MTESETVELKFKPLRNRLKSLEGRLNPDGENLHFAMAARVSAADFADLQGLGSDAMEPTREHWDVFCESPYAAGMFWYDFMLLVSATACAHLNGRGSESVERETLLGLLEVVAAVSECMLFGGDSMKRTWEALGNLLLAFPDPELEDFVRERAKRFESSRPREFLESSLVRLRKYRKRDP